MNIALRHDSRLQAKEQEVASKVVDGEAILINLANGMYYSLEKVGGLVWSMVTGGSSIARIAEVISERYSIPVAQAQEDVRRLVEELLADGLIVVSDGEVGVSSSLAIDGAVGPYEAPTLVKYDDMAEMFALDPPLPELPPLSPKS
jgi:Coenzyme PQQ synthesis protein D (PqqD).